MSILAMILLAAVGETTVLPPAIDGKLDDACWAKAEWHSFKDGANTIKVAFAFKDDKVYFAMKPASGGAAVGDRPLPTLDIAPDGGKFEWYRFAVGADGKKEAFFFSESGNIQPDPYAPAWKASAGKDGVEAVFPLSAFYMTRHNSLRSGIWNLRVGDSSWQKVGGFPIRLYEDDFFVKGAAAKVTGIENGVLVGELRMRVFMAKAGKFEVTAGFCEKAERELKCGDTEVTLPARFTKGRGRFPIPIRLVRSGTDRTLARMYPLLVDYEPVEVTLTTPCYRRNFYPGQDSSKIVGSVKSFIPGKIKLTLEGPGIPKEEKIVKGGEFSFNTPNFAEGTAILTAEVGGEKKEITIRRILHNPNGGSVSWVENGALGVDGRKVFPRRMYAEGYMGGTQFDREYKEGLYDLHQTRWIQQFGSFELKYVGSAKEGWAIEHREAHDDVRPCDKVLATMDQRIARMNNITNKEHVCYYMADEPECRNLSGVYFRNMFEYAAEKDPYHVISMGTRAGDRYINGADWFETHPYLNPHLDPEGNRVFSRQLRELGQYIDAFKPEQHPDKVVGCTPTAFSYGEGDYPTFREYVSHVWCFLVHGAKSINPYAYHDLGDRPSIFRGVKFTNETIERLEEILLSGKRTMIVKDDYEAALWEYEGKRLFAIVNLKNEKLKVEVPFKGQWTAFRGSGALDGTTALSLEAYESAVFTSEKMDEGLTSYAEASAEVDKLEAERLGRDNQLMALYDEIEVTSSQSVDMNESAKREMFDGTRNVLAWISPWGKDKYYEISFTKRIPYFKELLVFGYNIDGFKVKIRDGGEWRELKPAKVEQTEFSRKYSFDEILHTVKVRLEFPKDKVELYEIEMPRVAGKEPSLAKMRPIEELQRAEETFWTVTPEKWGKEKQHWYVTFAPENEFVVFDFRKPRSVDGQYVNWGLYVDGLFGCMACNVSFPQPGLYTLRLPKIAKVEKNRFLQFRLYNVALDCGPIACVRGPSDFAEFRIKDNVYTVKVQLSDPCEDISATFWYDKGQGTRPLSVNGSSTAELRPLDASRRVWGTEVKLNAPVDEKIRPALKVSVLGGTLDRDLFTFSVKE